MRLIEAVSMQDRGTALDVPLAGAAGRRDRAVPVGADDLDVATLEPRQRLGVRMTIAIAAPRRDRHDRRPDGVEKTCGTRVPAPVVAGVEKCGCEGVGQLVDEPGLLPGAQIAGQEHTTSAPSDQERDRPLVGGDTS